MNSQLTHQVQQTRIDDFHRAAANARRATATEPSRRGRRPLRSALRGLVGARRPAAAAPVARRA